LITLHFPASSEAHSLSEIKGKYKGPARRSFPPETARHGGDGGRTNCHPYVDPTFFTSVSMKGTKGEKRDKFPVVIPHNAASGIGLTGRY